MVEIDKINTFEDFINYLNSKERVYYNYIKSDLMEVDKIDKKIKLDERIDIRVSKEEKELFKELKKEGINVSDLIRELLKAKYKDLYIKLHKEKIKAYEEEIGDIRREIDKKIYKLSKLLIEEFNVENAETRYKIKFEIKDLHLRKLKIENYLKQF